jgi:SAM-dependent methyltransferase
MANLRDVKRNWEIYGREDPLWSVLMHPDKRGGRWDPKPFFAAGEAEITTVLDHLEHLGVSPDFSASALDFGCGVGRLTQALARRFGSVWGVDISASMVERAQQFNRYPDTCRYVVNDSERLTMFHDGTFAFIYTSIVLQHIEPRFAIGYVGEFARVLRPGGVLVFQAPEKLNSGRSSAERVSFAVHQVRNALGVRTRTRRFLRRLALLRRAPRTEEATVEMHCIPEQVIRQTLARCNLLLTDVQLTNSSDVAFVGDLRYLEVEPAAGYVSKQYCAIKTS